MGQGPDGEAANPQPPASISCKVGEEVIPHGSQCSLRTCSSWAGWNVCSDDSRRATAAPVGWGLGGHPAQLGTVHWERVFGEGCAERERLAAGSACVMQGW